LLEDVSLEGARGVLVNITTAPGGLMMKEYKEIMAIVREYVNEDDEQAEVKFGTAEVADMPEDMVRVTIVATGLGQKNTEKTSHPDYLQVLKTGTNDGVAARQTGHREAVEQSFDTVVKRRRGNPDQLKNVDYSSPEFGSHFDIPAFLRKQND
jgi:cell division protein FtsZ